MLEAVGESRWLQATVLAAASAIGCVIVSPVALFAIGAVVVAWRDESPTAPAEESEPATRGGRTSAPVRGGTPTAVAGPATAEGRSASALATPLIAALRRAKELDADPKLSSEGSTLVGDLRGMSRTADAEGWPDLRSRLERWVADVRAAPQGGDAALVAQLARMEGILKSAP